REMEVFAQLGKGGDLATSDLEAICRIVSLWLRAGGSLHHVIKQLADIGSSLQLPTRTGRIMSLGDGLAQAMKRYQKAKDRHGLKALLLGEVDPADLDSEYVADRPNGRTAHPASDLLPVSPDAEFAARAGQIGADLPARGFVEASPRLDFKLKCPEPGCGGELYKSE